MPRYNYDPWKKNRDAGAKIFDNVVKTSFKVDKLTAKSVERALQTRAKEAVKQYKLQLKQQEFANTSQVISNKKNEN